MSFDWTEYVRLAEELKKGKSEAHLRSSISRAYYGVFCIARNKKGYKKHIKSDIHRKVIESYKNSNNMKEKYIGKLLDELRKQRNDADYNEDKPINKKLAEMVLLKARNILMAV